MADDSTPEVLMPDRASARSRQALLACFLEQGKDFALMFMDPRGIVLDWLMRAADLFGYTAGEVVGKRWEFIFTPEDLARGAADNEMEIARTVGRTEDDRWHLRKDGTRFWASGVMTALRGPAGEVVGYAKIMRDRTDLKTQTEALENRVAALAERGERVRAFLGTIAHELRNPLAPLVNAVELIRSADVPDRTSADALKIIDRQISTLNRLVDDLLDVTRLDTGKAALRLDVVELKDIVSETAALVRPDAEGRQQELIVLMIDGPVPVKGDATRLQQVLVNLLNNAIKYTPPRGKIWMRVTTEGGDAVVRVEDTGVGMSADILPRIFDVFTQEQSSRAVAPGGLGVGLSVVRELVKLHGGTVQARSEGKGKGSVFTVRLPLYRAAQP
jgi:two-component system CheB/CheR fusion protein